MASSPGDFASIHKGTLKGIWCEICLKQFSRPEHLRRHWKLHRNEKPYKCSTCDSVFARKDAAKRHEATHAQSSRQVHTKTLRGGSHAHTPVTDQDLNLAIENMPRPEVVDNVAQTMNKGLPSISPATQTNGRDFQFPYSLRGSLVSLEDPPFSVLTRQFEPPRKSQPLCTNPQQVHFAWPSFLGEKTPSKLSYLDRQDGTVRVNYELPSLGPRLIFSDPMSSFDTQRRSETASPGRVFSVSEDPKVTYAARSSERLPTEANQKSKVPTFPDWIISHASSILVDDILSLDSPLSLAARHHLLGPETLKTLNELYFVHFHPIFPFIYRDSLDMPRSGVLLCLATAAIGACFQNSMESEDESNLLHLILNKALMAELTHMQAEKSLYSLQSMALHAIGLIVSSREKSRDLGYAMAAIAFEWSRKIESFHLENNSPITLSHSNVHGGKAIEAECRSRTQLFVHMLNTTLAFLDTSFPLTSSTFLRFELPGPDNIWKGSTGNQSCYPQQGSVTFEDALCQLYQERRLVPGLSEFGLTGLIYGVIRQTLGLAQQIQDPLLSSIPDGEERRDFSGHKSINLVRTHMYEAWKNSACDCLDILHWEMLSRSAEASGREGPIFLHLHLARLVILTPYQELLRLFSANCGTEFDTTLIAEDVIKRWLVLDQHKARLAVLHAGAMFWHQRRYGADSFLQPFGIFLAALVLWAYGNERFSGHCDPTMPHFSPHTDKTRQRLPSLPFLPISDQEPEMMYVDRPFDDELAQLFIGGGYIQLYMRQVGKLSSPEGPSRVLQEAKSLLQQRQNIWGVSKLYIAQLDKALAREPE